MVDPLTYVRSDSRLRMRGVEHLGAQTLRTVVTLGRRATRDLPVRALESLTARLGMPRAEVDPADPPWCPPDGASWKILGDPSALVGGFAALWVQALHPLALAGVMEHSGFEADPLGRLQRTGGFVGTTTFAPGSEAQAAVDHVREVHTRIVGTAPDGRPYAAGDPELLDWVHCALLLCIARAWVRFGGSDDIGLLDDFVAEQRRPPMELGDPDPPSNWAELLEHIDHHRPSLCVNDQTRYMDRWLMSPTFQGPERVLLPAYQAVHSAAIATAPDWAHELYGTRRFLPARRAGEVLAVSTSALFRRVA
jgi:uncharacterized protein (DUF2236 family)